MRRQDVYMQFFFFYIYKVGLTVFAHIQTKFYCSLYDSEVIKIKWVSRRVRIPGRCRFTCYYIYLPDFPFSFSDRLSRKEKEF